MNASNIDPFTLPSLSLNKCSRLPYCLATQARDGEQTCLYISKIVNLAQRWATYHRSKEVTITQKALKKSTAKNKHSLFHE
ncbi:hypothetical protein NIES4075_70830 [Tolypothrix sp. NIES-4075]|nr:hypothetical protein NIES4075_70830 [Tolypothrix sp. NIES-4075]